MVEMKHLLVLKYTFDDYTFWLSDTNLKETFKNYVKLLINELTTFETSVDYYKAVLKLLWFLYSFEYLF